jgi:hypothetical protein
MSGSAALPTELFGNANDLMISSGGLSRVTDRTGFFATNDLLRMSGLL